MQTSRRNLLKAISLTAAGLCIPKLEVFASPATGYLADGHEESPIRLSSNENPYGPSPLARKAMADSVNISNRYQWDMISDLITAIAQKNNLTYDNVLIGAGSTQIIDAYIQFAALQKGNFILADPTFSRWKSAAEKSGLQKISIPLTAEKRHDLLAMANAIDQDTRMIYVCNPNNPTGTICQHEALVSFINEATAKTLVLVDEAYIEYAGEPSLGNLVVKNENLIVIKTFSKIYGLAGARIGYALANEKTIERISQLQSGSDIGVSAVSLAAALASLKDDDFVKKSFSLNEQARKYTMEQLALLNMNCIPSFSNFIYFSLSKYENDFFAQLKTNNIQGTEIFEESGKWSRITVGTMEEMQKFIRAVA